MAIERLEGYAIAAAVVGRWGDHVYVTSSDGSVWPCWGRGAGGTALPGAAGYGEQSVADCISQQFSRAGIAYGLTGVCHQIANRILFPATGASVMQARGYWASHLAFGTYGLPLAALPWQVQAMLAAQALLGQPPVEDWPIRRQKCMPPTGASMPSASRAPGAGNLGQDVAGEAQVAGYLTRVNEILLGYAEQKVELAGPGASDLQGGVDLVRIEADLATELRFGSQVDPKIREHIRSAYATVFVRRHELLESLAVRQIGPGAYLAGLDDIVGEELRNLAGRVGADAYNRYFGFPPEQGLRVVELDAGWPYLANVVSQGDALHAPDDR